jgi:hypothetical protein
MTQKVETAGKTLELQVTASAVMMGICTTCNDAPTCVNLKASSQPIWHCDQFDDYVPPSDVSSAHRPAATPPIAKTTTNGSFEGLCSTCGNKDGCVNQTPGTSKMFCEEFC